MGFPPPMESLLGLAVAVPAGIAIASGAKDRLTKGVCYALVVLGVVLFLAAPVEAVEDVIRSSRLVTQLFCLLIGVLCVIAAVRLPNRIIGTLLVSCGAVIAAKGTGLLGGWAFL